MPFHHPDFEVTRMSKDIDILTAHSVVEVEQAMDVVGEMGGLQCDKITPKNPHPIENLVSYTVAYDSRFGRRGHVKVDAFCGADLDLETRLVPLGSQILDFETLQDITILSRGALMADKITSLAVGTVGVDDGRHTEIIKQIYDIVSLLRHADAGDIETAYDSYQILTEFKAGCFRRDPPYTVFGITASVVQTLCGLLPLDTKELVAPELLRRYSGFGNYLSKLHPRRTSAHTADLILVLVFAMFIQKSLEGNAPPSEAGGVGRLHQILENLGRLKDLDTSGARRRRSEYLNAIPGRMISRRMIKDSPLEHLYLISELAAF